jgi:GT2 family glycosyltransferase
VNAVDIIVPVFNAATDVAQCLAALQAHTPAFARVNIVDDASSDATIAPMLEAFAARAPFAVRLLKNPRNLGFVGSVNSALASVKNDVVLLNSDTIVTPGWLAAMARAAEQLPQAASFTPWSNNAEICSFPQMCVNNAVPSSVALTAIARACASITPRYPELPTGVGFCLFMPRNALRAVGDFDAATFGRGYGEENDWCLRAKGLGMASYLCDNAFVAHTGGRSFAATGERPGGENLKRLSARYPAYEKHVSEFIAADPLVADRRVLAAALARI